MRRATGAITVGGGQQGSPSFPEPLPPPHSPHSRSTGPPPFLPAQRAPLPQAASGACAPQTTALQPMRTCGCGRRVERVRACGRWGQGRRWEAERAQRCEVFVSWAVAVVAAQLRGISLLAISSTLVF
ncbi:unnamed protein product [Lepidochelys olivacea]